MSDLCEKLFCKVAKESVLAHHKVTVVGTGQVGMAAVISMLTQSISSDVAMISASETKLMGELMDLQHGLEFIRNVKISASTEYSVSAGSRLCIITAGARRSPGQSRMDLLQTNIDILKSIIPQLLRHSPDATLLIVTNPVDVMTYVAWKVSGLPLNRVIGAGTNLDSSRFRFSISQQLGIAPEACHGWIIGEHGDSSVPVWSGVNVAGVALQELHSGVGSDDDTTEFNKIHHLVVNSGAEIIKRKGYTSWAIGLSVASIARAILHNSHNICAVSTLVTGMHGIEQEVFLSLPCVLGSDGIEKVVKQNLTEAEATLLRESANKIYETQAHIKF